MIITIIIIIIITIIIVIHFLVVDTRICPLQANSNIHNKYKEIQRRNKNKIII
jgi:cell division protein FtsL